MNKNNKQRFVIRIDLGHRVARLIVHAENLILAILKAFMRFSHKQQNINCYTPIIQ